MIMVYRNWHEGPPPHIGWWNASRYKSEVNWKWWDGQCWSQSATPHYTLSQVKDAAGYPDSADQSDLEWTSYWPEDARVPRMKP